MATLGYSNTPGYGTFSQISTTTEVAVRATTPVGGIYITQLAAYMHLYSGSGYPVWLCVWDGSGNLLVSVQKTGFFFNSWVSASVNNVFVAGGQTIYIGFATTQAHGFTAPYDNTGTSYWGVQASPPGNTTFSGTGFGNIGAYLTYVTSIVTAPNDLLVSDGTALHTLSLFAFDGAHLQPAQLLIFDGSILRRVQ